MDTIGFVELSSISRGIITADAMLKAADLELVFAKPSCPGKYYILVTGLVSGVETALKQAEFVGGEYIISSIIIPRLHPQVIKAVNMAYMPDEFAAIGILEFFSVTNALLAADVAAKAARIELVDVRLGTGIGGKSFIVLTGDTASVTTAVNTAAESQKDSGMLVNKEVIPNPNSELLNHLL